MAAKERSAPPELLKQTITRRVEHFLEDKFKPGLAVNAGAAREYGFNYVVELYTIWRGRFFYICAKYCNPRAAAAEEFFEVRTTRLEYVGGRNFSLAYMRHTGRWCEVYPALSLEECLETIEQEEMFWPVH